MAKKLPLDLSKFKKIREDNKIAVLKHPAGHEIHIAKNALTSDLRETLKALPTEMTPKQHYDNGGGVQQQPSSKQYNPQQGDPQYSGLENNTNQDKRKKASEGIQKAFGKAKGGEIQHFDEGTDVPIASSPEQEQPMPENLPQVAPNGKVIDPNANEDTSKFDVGNMSVSDIMPEAKLDNQSNLIPDNSEQASSVQTPHMPEVVMNEVDNSIDPSNVTPTSAPSLSQQPQPESDALKNVPNFQNGYNAQMAGIKNQAATEQQLAVDDARAAAKAKLHLDTLQKYMQSQEKPILGEIESLRTAIKNGEIKSDHLWNSYDTGQKIRAGIGLILAGFNPTNRPNAAAEFLQHQIDNDLKAQEMNMNNKQNLLRANMELLKNRQDAVNMSRIMMLDSAAQELKYNAAKAGSPLAMARAQIEAGKLEQSAAPAYASIMLSQGLTKATQEGKDIGPMLGTLAIRNPELYKEIAPRYVPNSGPQGQGEVAQIPLTDKMRGDLQMRQSLQQQINNLRTWSQQHAGSLNPADMAYGKALAATVQDAYRRANGQGVFREAESNFVKSIVEEDPTKFFNKFRTDPKYKALGDSNLTELNSLRQSVGLPIHAPTQQPQYKIHNGVKYMRGPNGQAIPVK